MSDALQIRQSSEQYPTLSISIAVETERSKGTLSDFFVRERNVTGFMLLSIGELGNDRIFFESATLSIQKLTDQIRLCHIEEAEREEQNKQWKVRAKCSELNSFACVLHLTSTEKNKRLFGCTERLAKELGATDLLEDVPKYFIEIINKLFFPSHQLTCAVVSPQ